MIAGAYMTITDALMRWWHYNQATQYLFNIFYLSSILPFSMLVMSNRKKAEKIVFGDGEGK